MTLIISILLYVFGLDPATGRIQLQDKTLYKQLKTQTNNPKPDPRKHLDKSEEISSKRNSKKSSSVDGKSTSTKDIFPDSIDSSKNGINQMLLEVHKYGSHEW